MIHKNPIHPVLEDMKGHSRDPLSSTFDDSVRSQPFTPEWARREAQDMAKAEKWRVARDFAFGVFIVLVFPAIVWFFIFGGIGGGR